jgi:hypothetical protein
VGVGVGEDVDELTTPKQNALVSTPPSELRCVRIAGAILATLSINPGLDGIYREFSVTWTSLSITNKTGTTTYMTAGIEERTVLDSGTAAT